MGQSHYWFATDADFKQIAQWLRDAGAESGGDAFHAATFCSREEIILQFPAISGITLWPEDMHLSAYPTGSPRWKSAFLAMEWMKNHPGKRMIDSDFSPVALLRRGYKRDGRYWTSGELHFTGTHLKERFPKLNSICGAFGRWLAKQQLVFDNIKKERFSPFDYNLCMSGIVRRIYAFQEAYEILSNDGIMVDRMASDSLYEKFRRSLELRGVNTKPVDK